MNICLTKNYFFLNVTSQIFYFSKLGRNWTRKYYTFENLYQSFIQKCFSDNFWRREKFSILLGIYFERIKSKRLKKI